jgi:CRISPR-associated endonuclease/helicase Cas3
VIVRWDERLREKMTWLRPLHKWARRHDGKTMTIDDLSNQLKRTVVEIFEEQDEPAFFGHLPNRAAWTAGLYWHLLQQQASNNRYVKQLLFEHFPPQAKIIGDLLKKVRQMANDSKLTNLVNNWCDRFEQEARILRNIERRIKVVDENGSRLVAESFLQRETWVLESGLLQLDEYGNMEVYINAPFASLFKDEPSYVPTRKKVYFPHKPDQKILEDDSELVDNWCDCLTDSMEKYLWKPYQASIQAAEKLVRLTGLVVSDDEAPELESNSGVI